MENFTITMSELLFIMGAIATIGAAFAVIKKIPIFNHESRILKLERHEREQFEVQKVLCKGVLCLLTHVRTGNGIDNIIEAEKDIQKVLIEK